MLATSDPRRLDHGPALRVVTLGEVDDGKSTLLGRLLVDARAMTDDQLAEVTGDDGELRLANATDGLRAERDRGITIDVAHRYLRVHGRRIHLVDAPGHRALISNALTAISGAHLALVMVDPLRGLTEQTKRHLLLAVLGGIRRVVLVVNKMDLAGFSQDVVDGLRADAAGLLDRLGVDWLVLGVSALQGDNVVQPSDRLHTDGTTVLSLLKETAVPDSAAGPLVACVSHARPGAPHVGLRILSGRLSESDKLIPLHDDGSRGVPLRVRDAHIGAAALDSAHAPQSITVTLDGELARGDWLVGADVVPVQARQVVATGCWLATARDLPAELVALQHARRIPLEVGAAQRVLDVASTCWVESAGPLHTHDIAVLSCTARRPLWFVPEVAATKRIVLVDPVTRDTVGSMVAHLGDEPLPVPRKG